jgi:hypothetical protein
MYYAATGDVLLDDVTTVEALQVIEECQQDSEARSRCRRIQLEVIHAFVTSSKDGKGVKDDTLAREILTRIGEKHTELVRVRKYHAEASQMLHDLRCGVVNALHAINVPDNEIPFDDKEAMAILRNRAVRYRSGFSDALIALSNIYVTLFGKEPAMEVTPGQAVDDIITEIRRRASERARSLAIPVNFALSTLRDIHGAMYECDVPDDQDELAASVLSGFRQLLDRTIKAEKNERRSANRLQKHYELVSEVYASTGGKLAGNTSELLRALRDWIKISRNNNDRAERLLVQLAGCGVAATGWNNDPAKQGDYGWSPAYQDVLDLRRKYERLVAVARGCHDYNGGYRGQGVLPDVFHEGIQTVISALEAAMENPQDSQVKALEIIGQEKAA